MLCIVRWTFFLHCTRVGSGGLVRFRSSLLGLGCVSRYSYFLTIEFGDSKPYRIIHR